MRLRFQRVWVGPLVGVGAALLGLVLLTTHLFESFEQKTVDTRLRLRGTAAAATEVVVLAIDSTSIDRKGQWPWPRTMLADVVDKLHAAGAKAIAFDVFFTEPDRCDPQGDAALAAAFAKAGNVVPGFYLSTERGLAPDADAPMPAPVELASITSRGFPALFDLELTRLKPDIPILQRAAPAGGHCVITSDPGDGTLRHYSLILPHEGTLYPALALRAVQVSLGSPPIQVTPENGVVPLVRLGDLTIPTSEKGELWINFRGSWMERRTFKYVPIADVVDGRHHPQDFADKIVFIGATDTGLHDSKTTPFDQSVPGVEVHATVADNILHRRFLRDGALEMMWSFLGLFGVTVACGAAASGIGRPLRAAFVAGLVILGYAAISHLALVVAYRHLALFVPVVAGVLTFTGVAVWRNVFAEAQTRQIRRTFQQYVSPSIVEEMLRHPEKVRLGGERRELTVLFTDIRGFTALSEKLEPEQVVALLNEYLTPMSRVIQEHGGTIDKYIGDAIMAIFGAPVALPDHAARACAAALAMLQEQRRLSTAWAARGLPQVSSGIGINTGPMAVGNMGSAMIFDYTVIGDNVNLASRLEGLTRKYDVDVVVSESTLRAAGPGFEFRELGEAQVKGRQEGVQIYELVDLTTASARPVQMPGAGPSAGG